MTTAIVKKKSEEAAAGGDTLPRGQLNNRAPGNLATCHKASVAKSGVIQDEVSLAPRTNVARSANEKERSVEGRIRADAAAAAIV